MELKRDDLLKNLKDLREQHGEDAYEKARDSLARMLLRQPKGPEFLKDAFPDHDFGPLLAEMLTEVAAEVPSTNEMLTLIHTYLPHLKTGAQLDLFMVSFYALTQVFEYSFMGDVFKEAEAREVLRGTLERVSMMAGMAEQVSEIPDQDRSQAASRFVDPPSIFGEAKEQLDLLTELAAISTQQEFNSWYRGERSRIDSVVSKQSRDTLFDAIRTKRGRLAN